jgi:hypothetical protein
MSEIKTIRQANDRLAALGQKRQVFSTLKQAQLAGSKAEKKSLTPNKPIKPLNPSGLPDSPIKPDNFESLKAAATAERDASRKIDLLTALSGRLLNSMNSEKDLSKKTELTREWQRVETQRAQALLAERIANPAAAKARKYIDAASR